MTRAQVRTATVRRTLICERICPDCAGEGWIRQEKARTICITCKGKGLLP